MPTKILAIDDSKTMRLAIKITFAAEDAKVTAVSKGSEAVARAKQMQADVILVDHKLGAGEPSGFEVVQALKSNPATASIPVIMLIPAKGAITEADVSAAGADGYIGKPFDSQELIDKVATSLGRAVKPAAPTRAAARPPVAAPPAAAARKPVAAPPAAAAPPVAAPPAAARKPVPTPAPAPAARPPAAAVKPAPAPARPTPAATPAAVPAAAPARVPTARPTPARAPASSVGPAAASGPIPIAVPIPFTAASSPTPGMLERIKAAAASGGAVAGLDPAAVQALLRLSQEIVEQVVWEVVPDLAEEIIKQKVR